MKSPKPDLREDPLSPGDGLWTLLSDGQPNDQLASPVFVQNVVREVRRSTADDTAGGSTFVEWMRDLFRRPAFAFSAVTATTAVAAVLALVVVSQKQESDPQSVGIAAAASQTGSSSSVSADSPETSVAASPPAQAYTVADQLVEIDYLGELVAVTDPGELNDQMMADLLY